MKTELDRIYMRLPAALCILRSPAAAIGVSPLPIQQLNPTPDQSTLKIAANLLQSFGFVRCTDDGRALLNQLAVYPYIIGTSDEPAYPHNVLFAMSLVNWLMFINLLFRAIPETDNALVLAAMDELRLVYRDSHHHMES